MATTLMENFSKPRREQWLPLSVLFRHVSFPLGIYTNLFLRNDAVRQSKAVQPVTHGYSVLLYSPNRPKMILEG